MPGGGSFFTVKLEKLPNDPAVDTIFNSSEKKQLFPHKVSLIVTNEELPYYSHA